MWRKDAFRGDTSVKNSHQESYIELLVSYSVMVLDKKKRKTIPLTSQTGYVQNILNDLAPVDPPTHTHTQNGL